MQRMTDIGTRKTRILLMSSHGDFEPYKTYVFTVTRAQFGDSENILLPEMDELSFHACVQSKAGILMTRKTTSGRPSYLVTARI